MPEIVIRISVPEGAEVVVEAPQTETTNESDLDPEVVTRMKRGDQTAQFQEQWARWAIETYGVQVLPAPGKTGPYGRINVFTPRDQKRRRFANLTTPSARLFFKLGHEHADDEFVTPVFNENRGDGTVAPTGVAVRLKSPEHVEAAKRLTKIALGV